jgi:serine/threonine protein kinase
MAAAVMSELMVLNMALISAFKIGAFGEVRMCVHRDTGAQRAVKVLRKSHMDEDEKKMLFNEINILRNLVSHPKKMSPLLILPRPLPGGISSSSFPSFFNY